MVQGDYNSIKYTVVLDGNLTVYLLILKMQWNDIHHVDDS